MPSRRSPHNTKDDLQAVRLDQLVLLDDLQVRVQLDLQTVREYKQIFQEVPVDQCTCPAIHVYMHQGSYVVSDGFHRVTAARQAGRTTLNAYVRQGSLDDAWLNAMETNMRHGKPYSIADRQKIVTWFLDHPRYGERSNRDIAALTGNLIPHSTVANIRNRRKLKKLSTLQEVSNLDKGIPVLPNLVQQVEQVQRAYSRIRDAVALILGVTHEMQSSPAELAPAAQAVRDASARLAAIIAEITDYDDPRAGFMPYPAGSDDNAQ